MKDTITKMCIPVHTEQSDVCSVYCECPTCGKRIALDKCSGIIQSVEKWKPQAGIFRNLLSLKEFAISGMCQECQDSVFGRD